MYIQYVLDVNPCAVYMVNYISKGQKEMSELLTEACAEARKGNTVKPVLSGHPLLSGQ